MEIMMSGADIKVGSDPAGNKAIVAEDVKSGVRVLIPLTEEGARSVAKALLGGIELVKNINGAG